MNTFNLHQALSSVEGLRAAFVDCKTTSPFDAIRQIRADGSEFWSARDLQAAFGYVEWRKFSGAIERARLAARNAGTIRVEEGFVGSAKTQKSKNQHGDVDMIVEDFHLSRYASYLVAMNGDPHKPEIAAAQHYFAMRTREAEIGAKEQPRESSYMKAFKAGILFAMQLPQREAPLQGSLGGGVAKFGRTTNPNLDQSQPRTNRVQPIPTYHRKGEGPLPVKIAPWTHPKIEDSKADILAMPGPTSMPEIFKMLKERGVLRNRANEMAVAFILKESGLYRRRQYRVGGGGCTWVYERI